MVKTDYLPLLEHFVATRHQVVLNPLPTMSISGLRVMRRKQGLVSQYSTLSTVNQVRFYPYEYGNIGNFRVDFIFAKLLQNAKK